MCGCIVCFDFPSVAIILCHIWWEQCVTGNIQTVFGVNGCVAMSEKMGTFWDVQQETLEYKQKYNKMQYKYMLRITGMRYDVTASSHATAEHQLARKISCYVENWQIYVSTDVRVHRSTNLQRYMLGVKMCITAIPQHRSTQQISSCLWAASQSLCLFIIETLPVLFFSLRLLGPTT